MRGSTTTCLPNASERAENLTHDASTEVRRDASQGLDEASDTVAPEEEDDTRN
jgi:hypothetical protein